MTTDTLPHWLRFQTGIRAQHVAIRHKQLGIWYEHSWQAAHKAVVLAAQLLKQKGFTSGDTLFLLSEPRPEALLLSLAAHWLGGVSAPLDPAHKQSELLDLLHTLRPRFIFAEAQAQVDQVFAAKPDVQLLIFADSRGLADYHHPAMVAYSQIAEQALPDLAIKAAANDIAFRFYRLSQHYQLEYRELTHAELLKNGQTLVLHEALTDREEALAARAFAASGHARYLLSPWLIAGFKLNFPENLATRDSDRRELGPSLVAGTAATYQRLYVLTLSRWPLQKSWQFALVQWALKVYRTRVPLLSVIAHWLVIAPLKDVLGLGRTRVPLLVGEPLSGEAEQFFSAIGIQVRGWPEETTWHISQLQVIPQLNSSAEAYFALKGLRAAS
ncbi:AMP-binding protein [Methylophilus sp.]|uniref:AMP-binding protein n=1 Tax=Methylophilus sp. TaxID=29541 RepID=UPI004036CA45